LKLEQGAKVQSSTQSDQYERDVSPLVPNVEPPLHAPPRYSDFKNDQLASNRPSIGRRVFRALARFFIAVLIGVGATLVWQSYGDEANGMVRTWAPSLAWLLPVSTTKSPPVRQVSAQDAALPQSASVTQTPAAAMTSPESVQQLETITRDLAVVRRSLEQLVAEQEQMAQAVTSPESVQQLEPITRDLAAVRRSLEQLAAKQEQMAQNIATLQAVEQDIRQEMSSPRQEMSSPPPSQAVPLPPRRPPQPAARSSAVRPRYYH
jgi:uncharacterized protein YoxC